MKQSQACRCAVLERLRKDQILLNLLGKDAILDRAPRRIAYPYIVLETLESTELDADCTAQEHVMVFQIFTRNQDRGELLKICEGVEDAVIGQPIVSPAIAIIDAQVRSVKSIKLRDGQTMRGTITLRIVSEPI